MQYMYVTTTMTNVISRQIQIAFHLDKHLHLRLNSKISDRVFSSVAEYTTFQPTRLNPTFYFKRCNGKLQGISNFIFCFSFPTIATFCIIEFQNPFHSILFTNATVSVVQCVRKNTPTQSYCSTFKIISHTQLWLTTIDVNHCFFFLRRYFMGC